MRERRSTWIEVYADTMGAAWLLWVGVVVGAVAGLATALWLLS